ncbi:hypothetical protein GGR55DRAFT_313694 [Xylaria sp. FL0064]|nr:hypothetical protein GGR55DRAFT_313694 [Xylaria sp. FL0064]
MLGIVRITFIVILSFGLSHRASRQRQVLQNTLESQAIMVENVSNLKNVNMTPMFCLDDARLLRRRAMEGADVLGTMFRFSVKISDLVQLAEVRRRGIIGHWSMASRSAKVTPNPSLIDPLLGWRRNCKDVDHPYFIILKHTHAYPRTGK